MKTPAGRPPTPEGLLANNRQWQDRQIPGLPGGAAKDARLLSTLPAPNHNLNRVPRK